jgi:hypothetical protein
MRWPWPEFPFFYQIFSFWGKNTLSSCQNATKSLDTNSKSLGNKSWTQNNTAFDAMTSYMWDFKQRYFLTPPLQDPDYIALVKTPDTVNSPSGEDSAGVPSAQVTVETFRVGRHKLGAKIIYVVGSPTDPANKGYRIWYSVVTPVRPRSQTRTTSASRSLPNGKRTSLISTLGTAGKRRGSPCR